MGYFLVSYDNQGGSSAAAAAAGETSIFFPGELNSGNYTCSADKQGSVSNTCFCSKLFDQPHFTPESVAANVRRMNEEHSPESALLATNILFTNGRQDPWSLLGVQGLRDDAGSSTGSSASSSTADTTATAAALQLQLLASQVPVAEHECGQCATFNAESKNDPSTLLAARKNISRFIGDITKGCDFCWGGSCVKDKNRDKDKSEDEEKEKDTDTVHVRGSSRSRYLALTTATAMATATGPTGTSMVCKGGDAPKKGGGGGGSTAWYAKQGTALFFCVFFFLV
jgi:hypothetical protein